MIKYLLLLPAVLLAKTLVFTTAFNRPDFIELQHRLFQKFLQDDYEYIVVSDANKWQTMIGIDEKCRELGIRCIVVPQEIHDLPYLLRDVRPRILPFHNPNVRHCNAAQWAWDNHFSKHDGPVMLIDSDMFLIRPFSVQKYLGNRHLAGVSYGTADQVTGESYHYLWLALIMFNNPILPERSSICFNCGFLPNTRAICDSGGWTNLYLSKFKDLLNTKFIEYVPGYYFYCPYRERPEGEFDGISPEEITEDLSKRGFTKNEIDLVLKKPYTIELIGNNHFFHYRAGTNYEKYSDEFVSTKDKVLMEFFEKILSQP